MEYVLSGHRLKLYVPKEGVTIVFAPSGVKTPARAQPAGNGKPATTAEPFAEDVLAFTRELLMQRDVEIQVETMDRGGTFLGSITLPAPQGPGAPANAKPTVFSVALLRAGLARLQDTVDMSRVPDGIEMQRAEQAAKEARLRIWQNWSPEQEEAEAAAAAGPSSSSAAASQEVVQVTVTEVVDASEFYVQLTNEPRVNWLTEQLAGLGLSENPPLPVSRVCAQAGWLAGLLLLGR